MKDLISCLYSYWCDEHYWLKLSVMIFIRQTLYNTSILQFDSIALPSQEVADLWLPLSGAEGEGKEGMIHVILSLTPIAPGAPLPQQPRTVPNVAAGGRPMTYAAQPQPGSQGQEQQQQQPQRPPRLTDAELEEFVKMFPNLDRDIIASVHAASGGDKETMVNNLLQLGQQ